MLDKIYSEGKTINRKEEFEKGTSKFIFKIKANNKEYNAKEDILREIQSFYQIYTLLKIFQTHKFKIIYRILILHYWTKLKKIT